MENEKKAAANDLKMPAAAMDKRSSAFLKYLSEVEEGHYEVLATELEKVRAYPGWEVQTPAD